MVVERASAGISQTASDFLLQISSAYDRLGASFLHCVGDDFRCTGIDDAWSLEKGRGDLSAQSGTLGGEAGRSAMKHPCPMVVLWSIGFLALAGLLVFP